eukprot:80242-Pyramimonas_sp.AAC.1
MSGSSIRNELHYSDSYLHWTQNGNGTVGRVLKWTQTNTMTNGGRDGVGTQGCEGGGLALQIVGRPLWIHQCVV